MILIIYPPFSNPFGPSLGPAFLKSYIEANSDFNINFYDFNIKLHNKIVNEELSEIAEKLKNKNIKSNYFRKYSNTYYKRLQNIYTKYNKKIIELFKKNQFDYFDKEFKEIFDMVEKNNIKVIGFSHLFNQQIFMSRYLAVRLKQKYNITTVFGGHPIAHAKKEYINKDEIDFIIFQDGEEAFLQLLNHIKKNNYNLKKIIEDKQIEHIPNLIYKKQNEIKINQAEKFNLDKQIIPDYSDINFDEYLSPEPVINLVLGRGCFWNKCTFCTSPINSEEFRIRQIDDFVNEIKYLQKKYNINYFTFEDEMIMPSIMKLIANKLIEQKINIKYAFLAKPSHKKMWDFKLLKKSGCVNIYWGVETGNQMISNLMDKGTNIPEVKQILKNSHDAGISNCVFIMFGFPGETKKSFEDTIELIKQDYIDFISCSTFGLQKDTRIEKNPEQFKIKKIIKKRTILSDNYSFENLDNNSLSKTELEQIKLKYSPLLNAKNKWTDKINFYRNHILVLNE
ncbi:B12-binding domain-containing radical SAM protein [Candidatus Woesearchaeota archaeon]|jgi:anaerobic magnesium-protoporphyrin IX monomethyl ester cyclase|nr:B12-binding domain-containing radical SAM protein [Candidatus Woesearchaeota archaeon]MBT4387253.1 B12-binding domain-containing radical SAM protein [Candidatus Woesearchaeota archaeon]MBT4596254.1 B12-binding domain-containing radical SAM protein [Candidatus Woesearchaeota archaeon]MBT5741523.1 B12-binding domain-containing radical SAM protein [Candidatus Woesearchaeota archaeon]MBT7296979.1 B12-binding domain-containing radical SAM protein [Candidatus Woesearchaeota archaeon]